MNLGLLEGCPGSRPPAPNPALGLGPLRLSGRKQEKDVNTRVSSVRVILGETPQALVMRMSPVLTSGSEACVSGTLGGKLLGNLSPAGDFGSPYRQK